jgi:hypothetical protein
MSLQKQNRISLHLIKTQQSHPLHAPTGKNNDTDTNKNMIKPSWEERKLWLLGLRDPYLNFLRNLTPQAFLASMAWALAARINFTRIDFSGLRETLGFYILLISFSAATYANTTRFWDDAPKNLREWRKETKSKIYPSGK